MPPPTQSSTSLCLGQFIHAYSFKKCCFFVSITCLLVIAALAIPALLIVFVLKPKEPLFSIQTVKLDAYELDVGLNSTLLVSSVVSLTINTQNPNKVGIRYRPTRLYLLHEGIEIGEIRVPGFDQPARSRNVTVSARVLFHEVDVSQFFDGVSSENKTMKSSVQMKVIGDVTAHVKLLHVTLPKFQIGLDCDVQVQNRAFTLRNVHKSVKELENQFVSFSAKSGNFSRNCSVALYL